MVENEHIERAPRISLDVEVNCNGNKFVYSKNISESGIALIADTDFESGQFIQLKFMLPGNEKEIKAHGKVVRSISVSDNFYEIGVSFWDIQEEDQELLQAFFKNQK